MSFLKKLFGGGKGPAEDPQAEAVEYNGFTIYPEPVQEGSGYRIAARIEKVVDGETKSQTLMRADTLGNRDQAADMSLSKARQVIDERGERLFDGPRA